MRRDPDLVRSILLSIEESDHEPDDTVQVEVPGHTDREVSYHLMLLNEAGFIIAEDLSCLGSDISWEASRLTYAGHEFLDSIRDAEIWRRTKESAAKVGAASLQMLFDLAKAYGRQLLTERLGIALP